MIHNNSAKSSRDTDVDYWDAPRGQILDLKLLFYIYKKEKLDFGFGLSLRPDWSCVRIFPQSFPPLFWRLFHHDAYL